MKTLKTTILLLALFCGRLNGQDCNPPKHSLKYKQCLKEFYTMLFSEKSYTIKDFSKVFMDESSSYEYAFLNQKHFYKSHFKTEIALTDFIDNHLDTITSMVLEKAREYLFDLTFGLNHKSIEILIDYSMVYNEGFEFSNLMELVFPNQKSVFFEMSNSNNTKVAHVWLANGESLSGKIQRDSIVEKLLRPGMILSSEDSVDIISAPETGSQIVSKMLKDTVFYFSPNYFSDWWAISWVDGSKFLGYIHKSKILAYRYFPEKFKKRVKNIRGGC